MKRTLHGLLLIILLIAQPARAGELTVASDAWCPYACTGTDPSGFLADVAQEALSDAFQIRLVIMPWARALREALQGRVQAVAGVNPEDAPSLIFPEEPVIIARHCFITRKDDPWTYTGPGSLWNRRLGVISGYTYTPELNEYIRNNADSPALRFFFGPTPLQDSLKALSAGMVDVLIEEENVARAALESFDGSDLLLLRTECLNIPAYIAFSPSLAHAGELATKLNRGIRRLRESGRLRELMRSHGLRESTPQPNQGEPHDSTPSLRLASPSQP